MLGVGKSDGIEPITELLDDNIGGFIDPMLNERLLGVLSTKENVNLETLGFENIDTRKFQAIITPIEIAGERLGTLFIYKCNEQYDIDDIILCEYGTTVVGLEMLRAVNEESAEESRKVAVVKSAVSTLSFSEMEAITHIFDELNGMDTEFMSRLPMNEQLDVLAGLGNGYDTSLCGEHPLLIGGGAGVPPMFLLAKQLISEGKIPMVIAGFNTVDECFFEDEFKKIGARIIVATADGSCGVKGFVTDAMRCFNAESNDGITAYTDYCVCGPEPMLKAVFDIAETSGQLSFEERMGCGFGACMGCSCKTKYGSKRICKDGPVLVSEEVIW